MSANKRIKTLLFQVIASIIYTLKAGEDKYRAVPSAFKYLRRRGLHRYLLMGRAADITVLSTEHNTH